MARDTKQKDAFVNFQDYGIDLSKRRVIFHYHMGIAEEGHEVGVDHVVRNLLYLDNTSGEIELWINTPGGSFVEMWALYDVIQTLNNKVSAVAFGEVASAGCLILAGATGVRYAMPHASFMWHQGSGGFEEDVRHYDAQTRAVWFARELDRWCVAMEEHTGETKTWWKRKMKEGELWLDAEEMVKHGVVDAIWGEDE